MRSPRYKQVKNEIISGLSKHGISLIASVKDELGMRRLHVTEHLKSKALTPTI